MTKHSIKYAQGTIQEWTFLLTYLLRVTVIFAVKLCVLVPITRMV